MPISPKLAAPGLIRGLGESRTLHWQTGHNGDVVTHITGPPHHHIYCGEG